MSRNITGTYTLPSGNPVAPNTLIESAWANTTLSDVATALTDSLDRYGRGGMLAALKLLDGSAAAPGLAFTSESSSGLYRIGSNILGLSIAGVERTRWTSSGATITGALAVTGALTVGGVGVVPGNYVLKAGDTMTGSLINSAAWGLRSSTAAGTAAGLQIQQATFGDWLLEMPASASYLRLNYSSSERMRWLSTGQVGIGGTPVATYMLDVFGQTRTRLFEARSASGAVGISAGRAGGNYGVVGYNMDMADDTSDIYRYIMSDFMSFLQFDAGGFKFINGGASAGTAGVAAVLSTLMTLDRNGQLGIGGTPSEKLHVFGGRIFIDGSTSNWGQFQASTTGGSYFTFRKGGTINAVGYLGTDGGAVTGGGSGDHFGIRAEGDLFFMAGASERARINSSGVFTYGGIEVGYRSVPRTATGGLTATTTIRGGIYATTGGITVPSATFAAGDAFSIYNDSASAITVTQGSGLTLRLAGTATTGNRTLAARGMATVWFNSASEAIISGSGVS